MIKIATLSRVYKIIPAFIDALERSKSSVEEITAEAAETARDLEVSVKSELIVMCLNIGSIWRAWNCFKTRKIHLFYQ